MKRHFLLAAFSLIATAHAVEITLSDKFVMISNESVRLAYDMNAGTYSAKDIRSGIITFANARFTVDEVGWKQKEPPTRTWLSTDVADAFGKGKRLTIVEKPGGKYLPIKLLHITLYDNLPYAVLGFSVTNHRELPARICRVGILDKAKLFPGKKLEHPQLLRGGAGAEKNRIENTLAINAYNNLLVTGKINDQRHSLVVGGLHYREFFRQIILNERKGDFSITIEDPQGKRVEPGTTYNATDTVFLDISTADPFTSLETYGMALRTANQAHPKPYDFPTLCGWMVSQGSYGEGKPINNSKDLVGQMELATKSGILAYTPVAIRLEPDYYCDQNAGDTAQGWWSDEKWSQYNSLIAPYETFGKFCGKIRELGGIPFTYIQSNMPSNDFALAHPEWMLNNDITRLHAEHPHYQPIVRCDFTDPGFQAHTLAMWKRLGNQGLGGIKFDYPETAWISNGGFEDKTYTTTAAYRKVFELARAGLGEKAFIHERNLGESLAPMLDVTAGIVDLQRVWLDSSHFEPEMASRIGLRWYKARSVFSYYPDGKSFKKMDVDARRTMLSQVGLISGRLELGTSFGRMTAEEQHDLTRLYPILSGTRSFRPVDMLVEGRLDPSVYVYQIDPDWSQLIICNNFDQPQTVTAPISGNQADTGSLGHAAEASYYLYDFWNDTLIGEFRGDQTIKQELKPQQALTYSLHRKLDHPQFLSTNRHIMQGYQDLTDVTWNAENSTYSGTAKVIAGEPFIITLAPNGFTTKAATASQGTAELAKQNDLTRLTLTSDTSAEVKWTITWSK
jgi:hypothetical protein